MSKCYFLTLSRWNGFKQHINPALITVFQANHCYWLPSQVLVDPIKQMLNLEELSVLDTQIRLEHLIEVFGGCQNVTKLGFSLAGTIDLEQFQNNNATHWKQCFKRLTHLKLFNFTEMIDPLFYPRPGGGLIPIRMPFISLWPITFEVLR